MNLSTKGRYAVMAMVDLARNGQERPVALNEIAQRQEISLSYLEQLFAGLRRGGLVVSARGPGGGYRLAHAAENTRISDIMIAVEEPLRATRCDLTSSKGCTGQHGRCVTHDLWEELGRQIHIFLSGVTLADVVNKRVLGMSKPIDAGVQAPVAQQPAAE